jgi:hypothetical protein
VTPKAARNAKQKTESRRAQEKPRSSARAKAEYITADTLQSRVLICTLAAEPRRNRNTIRAGMSAEKWTMFAIAVSRLKALVLQLHKPQGHMGQATRIGSVNGHRQASGSVGLSLAERLVDPKTHDGQTQGVHCKLIVFHVFAKDVRNAGRPSLPLEFGMIRGIGVHLLELNTSRQ